jgi:hypothetical protein
VDKIGSATDAGVISAQGSFNNGAAIGRPRVVTDRAKVRQLRVAGRSLPAIAREINQHHHGCADLQAGG